MTSYLFAAVEIIEKAATREADFYQGQPITWALLGLLLALVVYVHRQQTKNIEKLWGHGHKIKTTVTCGNHSCNPVISVETDGVSTKEGI